MHQQQNDLLTRRVLDHLRVGRENMKRRQDCKCGCLGADPLGQGAAVLDSLSGSSPSSRSSQRVHLRFSKGPGVPPLRPPVPLLFGELVVRPAICYLVTDFFRGAAAKHPSLAAEANLPSSDMNRT
jgi:hypothetical protein